MKNKSSMGQALRNMRGRGVDVAIIINGQNPEEQEDAQEKDLGLAPDAERLEGTPVDGEEIVQEPGKIEDLQALLEGTPETAAAIGSLSKRAMKKGK